MPIRLTGYAALLALASGVTGCTFTERGVYEGIRQGQINECNQMPHGQRERCLSQITGEYEEYRRQREMIEDEQ
ncbi:hypothetical protein OOT55_17540 [Marinimicrobium sp. C6131]|uniref:hypothetical protein n=1 Tax=Marinimicrobium sp. C6131 TaxID=3022676 RepID=UPI00223D033B|nr:hypothetical protein [Marinimicrobium sp. C6131]UZJ44438.1 hypothetical protein OOT55_17540 [Marinimicrobium sp. C6131]